VFCFVGVEKMREDFSRAADERCTEAFFGVGLVEAVHVRRCSLS